MPNAKNVVYDVMERGAEYPRTFTFEQPEDFVTNIQAILNKSGLVFIAMKVAPEIENEPIGRRQHWQTRCRAQMGQDLRAELGLMR
jgi:hypothetical protein